jgi:hypothetical protein
VNYLAVNYFLCLTFNYFNIRLTLAVDRSARMLDDMGRLRGKGQNKSHRRAQRSFQFDLRAAGALPNKGSHREWKGEGKGICYVSFFIAIPAHPA